MKKYLDELSEKELKKVYENNSKLRDMVYESLYKSNMDLQYQLGLELLNDVKNQKNYRIDDHYASFFLTVVNAYAFIDNLDLKTLLDYGVISEEKKKEIEDVIEKFENSEQYSDEYNACEEKIETLADEVIKAIEKELHTYEEITENDCYDFFLGNIDAYEDFYITENKNYYAYQDITKCYK